MEKLNICLTGSTGFFGRKVMERLIFLGHNVFAITRNIGDMKDAYPEVTFIEYDMAGCNDSDSFSGISNIDCFLHLASFVPRSGNEDDFQKCIDVNVLGTMKLMERLKAVTKKVIYVSTLEVYGVPSALPITEDCPTKPLSYYGSSKLAAENFLDVYLKKNGIDFLILRYTSIYGPGENYVRALPNYINDVVSGRDMEVYGSGKELRDYLYIDDAVDALMLAVNSGCSGIFNVASGKAVMKMDVAKMIGDISGKEYRIRFVHPEYVGKDIVFDISKSRRGFGFEPKVRLMDGIRKQFDWCLSQNV